MRAADEHGKTAIARGLAAWPGIALAFMTFDVGVKLSGAKEAIDGTAAFDVRLSGAGAFPLHGRKIRALWLGIADGASELARLSAALTEPLAALGWPADVKPFAPHLTVARTDRASIADGALASQALEAAAVDWSATFRAQAVVLYHSVLGGGPPRHDPVETVVLRASAG